MNSVGTRDGYRSQTAMFDEAESGLNHGLWNLHQLVLSSAAATGALSCGTRHKPENERTHMDMALAILDRVQNEGQSPFDILTLEGK